MRKGRGKKNICSLDFANQIINKICFANNYKTSSDIFQASRHPHYPQKTIPNQQNRIFRLAPDFQDTVQFPRVPGAWPCIATFVDVEDPLL